MTKFFLSCLLAPLLLAGATTAPVVYSESFDSADALKSWRKVLKSGGATFEICDHALQVTHQHLQGGGGFIDIPVPVIRKGQLDFDVTIAPHFEKAGGIGLTLDLYNISTFWHDGCKDWRMYFAEPDANRMPFFFLEPVGHHKICPAPKNRPVHYRIIFDADADLVEFYCDDMKDPRAVRYDVSVLGHALYQGGVLRIGSFGYAPNPYPTVIDNIVLTETAAKTASATPVRRDKIIVFNGLGSDHYRVRKLFNGQGELCDYLWDSPGHSTANNNNYIYMKMPGFATVAAARAIVFNDAPNVPEALQNRLLESIKEGAHLIIFGGMASYTRGFFAKTPIGNELPVALDHRWDLQGSAEKPIAIDGGLWSNELLQGLPRAVITYYSDLRPTADAQILLSAAGHPVVLQRKYGKGTITAFTAYFCGPALPDALWNTAIPQRICDRILEK